MKRSLSMLLFLATTAAAAGVEKLTVTKLDFDYVAPAGAGAVERVGVGLGIGPGPYPLQVVRTGEGFEIGTPFADVTWLRPLKLAYEARAFAAREVSAALGTRPHVVAGKLLAVTTAAGNEYRAGELRGSCAGTATGRFERRLLEDCRTKMTLAARTLELPDDFILSNIISRLPLPAADARAIPVNNLSLAVEDGRFALELYLKLVFRAGHRLRGDLGYEDGYKTLVLRIDEVRFGELSVTNLFLRALRELGQSDDVTVSPPFVRINLEKLYEKQ
jgi:hypothetical protein